MKKVLIIEPNDKILKETTSYLIRNGFDVIGTNEGTAGVQKALEYLPDIILCDSESPGLNGYEVFNTLQQINTTAIIPFIFVKKNNDYEDIRAVMRLGADDYIIKPYDHTDLLELINTRLDKQERIMSIADEKFNTLMDFSANAIFIFQDGKLSYVNRKFCEIISYSQNELLGMSLVNIIYKDDINIVIEKIEKCLKGIYKELDVEFRAIGRQQDVLKVHLSGSIITIRGKKSIIGSVRMHDNKKLLEDYKELDINITNRENEVLTCICNGMSNHEISEELNISERTVEGHRANLLKKTDCKNSACLAIFAVKHGLFHIE